LAVRYRAVWISAIYLSVLPALRVTFHGSVHAESARHGMQNCVPGTGPAERQRCDEAVSDQLKASSQTTVLDGGWRLVKTRDPGGAGETVSAMRTVDTARSDINLAGLSLRCIPGGIQVVLIVLSSLPRASQPRVTLTAGANRNEFEASVTQGGGALLLPQAATSLAIGDWQNAAELSIEIATNSNPIRGIVPIAGLASALRSLIPNCAGK
jgi:hypothetical protein